MIQSYRITAFLDNVEMCLGGDIKTKNGVDKKIAELMCDDLKLKHKNRIENLKFYLEGEIIYED